MVAKCRCHMPGLEATGRTTPRSPAPWTANLTSIQVCRLAAIHVCTISARHTRIERPAGTISQRVCRKQRRPTPPVVGALPRNQDSDQRTNRCLRFSGNHSNYAAARCSACCWKPTLISTRRASGGLVDSPAVQRIEFCACGGGKRLLFTTQAHSDHHGAGRWFSARCRRFVGEMKTRAV